jgi:small redox-active disulfide protein 2
MKIEVLGTGCPKCDLLERTTREVADRLGLEYTLDHVKDIGKITSYGVMMTPALVIDGQVKVSGSVPSADKLEQMLAEQQ